MGKTRNFRNLSKEFPEFNISYTRKIKSMNVFATLTLFSKARRAKTHGRGRYIKRLRFKI